MTKKMGRPLKSSEPMTKRITIRLTEQSYKDFETFANQQGRDKIDLAREILLSAIDEKK